MLPQQALSVRGTRSEIQASSGKAGEGSFDLRRIGELLRETRERRGLSLSDVSNPLFLTKSTLGAIESGHWEVLPHPVYVKGYVKSYADYLDVYRGIEKHLHPVETSKNEGRDVAPAARGRKSAEEDGGTRHRRQLPLKGLALLCSSVVGLAFGITASASPALQETSSGCLNDVVMALQAMVMSL